MRRTLDTNICSYILRRHPASINERFAALSMTECSSPVINGPHMRYLPHVLAA